MLIRSATPPAVWAQESAWEPAGHGVSPEAHHGFCHAANQCWVPHCPDFLRRLVALIHFMRLSLMKGAHADLSSTAWQEIGVKPYFGLSGIMALDVPLSVCHARPKDKTPQKGTGSQFTRRF
jgi:hypothetical protein